jgi:UDP-2,3-diacylglucosamine pyrophosphatase LpxH
MLDEVEAGGWTPDQLAQDPCPQAVELSLAPGGRLVFVSDLHFTQSGPLADFQAGDALHDLVASIRDHPGDVILALGGDIVDLLQIRAPHSKAVPHILAGPDAVALGAALHDLAKRPGVTIVYLVGNHDAALAWHGEGRELVVRQFAVDHVALRLHVRLEGPDGGEVRLVAEHGDMLDLYNRRTDPFDPLDSPVGDHIVTEVVTRMDAASERRPDLALDQINNVRPTSMVPTWMVANFFYRYLSRALGDFALPLLGLFLLLHVPVVAVFAGGLRSRLGMVGDLGTSVLQWAIVIATVDLLLLVALFAFVGRSLQQAVATYGGSPSELSSKTGEDSATRRARSARLLGQRDPAARLLLHGHSHQAAFTHLDQGRVAVDSGCWIRALVPVRAWLDLPPVFVPSYPCTWIDVQTTAQGATVALWERSVAIQHRLNLVERLLTRGPLPTSRAQPAKVIASAVLAYEPAPSHDSHS